MRDILGQATIETNVRRGGNDLPINLSRSTFKRKKKQLKIKYNKGQKKTQARSKAEADPRNAYSEALLFNAFQTNIDPHLIINFDATTYLSLYLVENRMVLI